MLHGITDTAQDQIVSLGGNDFKEIFDLPVGTKVFVSKKMRTILDVEGLLFIITMSLMQ